LVKYHYIERKTCGKAVEESGKVKADKGQFDEVLRRMLQKPPQKTSEIKAEKKEPEKAPKPSRK
jgi:hypothetical protein